MALKCKCRYVAKIRPSETNAAAEQPAAISYCINIPAEKFRAICKDH